LVVAKPADDASPASYRSVAELPEFVGTAWRAESGYWHAPRTTVADIIRFEQEELGNEYPDVSGQLLKDLDRFSASDAIWVNRRRKDCLTYLSEGESEEAIGRVHLPEGSKIITPDYCGGFLVLRGLAKPMLEKGGNPMPRTESERLSFHERVFGKGSTPPLERLGRGQTVNELLPMPPDQGPPLPRGLNIKWPGKK